MKVVLSLFLFLLTAFGLYSQSDKTLPAITLGDITIEDDLYAGRNLKSKISALLKRDYTIIDNAPLVLDVQAVPGKITTINGMDTYAISNVEVSYSVNIDASSSSSQSKTVTVKVKGSNESDLKRKIGSAISRDKNTREALTNFLEDYISEKLGSCSAISSMIDGKMADESAESAYTYLGYLSLYSDCEDIAIEKENEILDLLAIKTCKALVNEAEILANGSTLKELTSATDKLLLVAPDSPCQEEVIRISQLVSTNAKELGATSDGDILIKLEQRTNQTISEWRDRYRSQYYRNR